MILCIAPNTNVERTMLIPGFHLGGEFRAQEEVILPSGKGINVARAIATLGGAPMCMGFLGGHTGRMAAALANAQGLQSAWTWIDGETRIAIAVVDPQSPQNDATLINESGPTVTAADWERLSADVLAQDSTASIACFSGSLPPGSPLDLFAGLIHRLQDQHGAVWVDCSGAGLKAAIQAGADGVKANAQEAAALIHLPVDNFDDALVAGKQLLAMGAGKAVITLGSQGSLLVTRAGVWMATPPAVKRLSTVGSGDAYMAGLLFELERRSDIPDALRCATAAGAANAQSLGGGRFAREDFDAALPGAVVIQME
jgi:1-phosphofructokinase